MTLMENNKYEEIEVNVSTGLCPSCGSSHYVNVPGWRTATKGLLVVRPLQWSPAPHSCLSYRWVATPTEVVDQWTVIHRRSGLSLLTPQQYFVRQKEAFKFAKRLGKHYNWTYQNDGSYNSQELLNNLTKSYDGVLAEKASEEMGVVVYDEDFDPPFIISVERTEGGRVFHVMDKVSGDTAFSFPHRGQAAEKAVELNLNAMV